MLITDYSSVAFDYLALNRPIILFCPDFDTYGGNRGFAFDPVEMNPGVLCRTKAELYALLADVDTIPASDRLAPLLTLFWADTADGRSCERVAAFIGARSEPARQNQGVPRK